jgi:hypothetical protein
VLSYEPIDKRITITHKGESVSFMHSEIKVVYQIKSYPLAENRMQWFPWDNYNYSTIRLNNGQEFIITSLLVPNMDLPIEPKKIKIIKSFYPFCA